MELVQLPLDLETGQCKGFGFVQVRWTGFMMILSIDMTTMVINAVIVYLVSLPV